MSFDLVGGSGFLTADDKQLEYRIFGKSNGATPFIVLMHEGLGCLSLWRDFPQRVVEATGLPVLAYSRAGYGHSQAADLPRPLDYMTREATVVLPDILKVLGGREFILLGHSDGATISAEYAGRIDDVRLKGVVLMAPHFFTEPTGLSAIANARRQFADGDMKARMAKYHRDAEATFAGWNDAWLHPEFRNWNVSHVLDGIRVPVLAIQGVEDQYGTLAQIETVKRRCPASVSVAILEDCRHSPHFDQPTATLEAITEFAGLVV